MNARSSRQAITFRPSTKEKSRKDLKIEDAFTLYERIFSAIGVWPLKEAPLRFILTVSYFAIYVACSFADLVDVLNDLELLVANLLESLICFVTFCIFFMIRFNSFLPRTLHAVKADMASLEFTSSEEMLMYLAYNHGSRLFGRIVICGAGSVSFSYFLSPGLQLLIEGKSNSSEPYVLPYKSKVFLDYSDFRLYVLLYLFQLPVLLVSFTHSSTGCLLVSLVSHLCGKLTILSHRIRNITTTTTKDQFDDVIAGLVRMHVSLVQMCKAVNDSFHLILLLILGETSFRVGLCMYAISTPSEAHNLKTLIVLIVYVTTVLLLIFSYCYVGEQLVQECKNVQDAFYYCNWQALPSSCRKSLLICMNYGQKHLTITAGGVYTFSLFGFSGIMKTAMAFVSMLRTMAQ